MTNVNKPIAIPRVEGDSYNTLFTQGALVSINFDGLKEVALGERNTKGWAEKFDKLVMFHTLPDAHAYLLEFFKSLVAEPWRNEAGYEDEADQLTLDLKAAIAKFEAECERPVATETGGGLYPLMVELSNLPVQCDNPDPAHGLTTLMSKYITVTLYNPGTTYYGPDDRTIDITYSDDDMDFGVGATDMIAGANMILTGLPPHAANGALVDGLKQIVQGGDHAARAYQLATLGGFKLANEDGSATVTFQVL